MLNSKILFKPVLPRRVISETLFRGLIIPPLYVHHPKRLTEDSMLQVKFT